MMFVVVCCVLVVLGTCTFGVFVAVTYWPKRVSATALADCNFANCCSFFCSLRPVKWQIFVLILSLFVLFKTSKRKYVHTLIA